MIISNYVMDLWSHKIKCLIRSEGILMNFRLGLHTIPTSVSRKDFGLGDPFQQGLSALHIYNTT